MQRSLGGRQKDRRHRCAHQPLGHFARICAEREHRPELFWLYRAVRAVEAGHLHGSTGSGCGPPGCECPAGHAFRPGIRPRNSRTRFGGSLMIDVVMPQMGESIVEGTLTKWLKKKGEHVERDEPLFEISTDKVDTEIPSPAAGTLSEVLVEEGKTVGINTVVARISDGAPAAAAAPAKPAAAAAEPAKAEPPSQTPPEPAQPPAATQPV